jgi:hypothetical protein
MVPDRGIRVQNEVCDIRGESPPFRPFWRAPFRQVPAITPLRLLKPPCFSAHSGEGFVIALQTADGFWNKASVLKR